ncbi:hypothetical protein ABID62_006732, partial [Bradyrhizobium sp. S3.9.1]
MQKPDAYPRVSVRPMHARSGLDMIDWFPAPGQQFVEAV